MLSFAAALLAAVALLAVAVVTGVRRRRSAHYRAVAAFFVALGVSIWRARALGQDLDFAPAAGTQLVHRIVVGLTFALVPFVVFSGVRLARRADAHLPQVRAGHRKLAVAFVVGILLSSVLGTLMTWQAMAAAG